MCSVGLKGLNYVCRVYFKLCLILVLLKRIVAFKLYYSDKWELYWRFPKNKRPEAGGGPVSISKTNWNVWERNYVICYVSLFEPMSVCTELGTDFLSWIKNQPRAGQSSHRRCKSLRTTFANAKLTLLVEVYGWYIKTMLERSFY